MKGHSIIIRLSLFLFLAVSCADQTDVIPHLSSKGNMVVELGSAVGETELVKTVRCIVFDNASTAPSLDVNVLWDDSSWDAKTFKATVDVKVNDDKMVIIVVNEPSGTSDMLQGIYTPGELENITFDMATAFNADHTVIAGMAIPMTSVKRGVSVDINNDANNPKLVDMYIERSIARVDLYIKKDSDIGSATVETTTGITLSHTHTSGYLTAGTQADGTRFQPATEHNFGKLLTVTNPVATVSTTYGKAALNLDATEQPVCSFFVPERTVNKRIEEQKLKLTITGITLPGGKRNGSFIVDAYETVDGNIAQPTDEHLMYRRNRVYKIIATVVNNEILFTCMVKKWEPVEQPIAIDGNYWVKADMSQLQNNKYIPYGAQNIVINLTTNYDGLTGYKAGFLNTHQIVFERPEYRNDFSYTITDLPVSNGIYTRRITISIPTSADFAGRHFSDPATAVPLGYIEFTVQAGNMVTPIRVTPSIACNFAKSNVITTKDATGNAFLTFAETDNEVYPANLQGTLYKWGSLETISPQGDYTGAWQAIPYHDTGNTDLKNAYPPGGYSTVAKEGDICRYISDQNGWVTKKWRMPIRAEYNILYNEAGYVVSHPPGQWTGTTVTNPGDVNKWGMYDVSNGIWLGAGIDTALSNNLTTNRKSPPSGVVFLPASGSRTNSNNGLRNTTVNSNGMYWLDGPAYINGTDRMGRNAGFNGSSVAPDSSNHPEDAFPVRCISE